MNHNDGDEEDLEEVEVLNAMKLAKKMNAMRGNWVTLGAAVEVRAADKRWYTARWSRSQRMISPSSNRERRPAAQQQQQQQLQQQRSPPAHRQL
jgi:hypothetical protein